MKNLLLALLFASSSFGATTASDVTITGNTNITTVGNITANIFTGNATVKNSFPVSGTNVTIDPFIQNWTWPVTANSRFEFGTNTITGTNKVYTIYIDIDSTSDGLLLTNVVDTISWGSAYRLKLGLQTISLTWSSGQWRAATDAIGPGYVDFIYPGRLGTGASMSTTYTNSDWGLVSFPSSAATNSNFAMLFLGTVPMNLDSTVPMVLKNLAFRTSGTNTPSESFTIGYYTPASGADYAPSDYTVLSAYIPFTTGTLTGADTNKIYYMSDVTLTNWASMTPGRRWVIGIARAGTSNSGTLTLTSGQIQYGRTQ